MLDILIYLKLNKLTAHHFCFRCLTVFYLEKIKQPAPTTARSFSMLLKFIRQAASLPASIGLSLVAIKANMDNAISNPPPLISAITRAPERITVTA